MFVLYKYYPCSKISFIELCGLHGIHTQGYSFILVHFLDFISAIYMEQFLISTHLPAFCRPESTEDSETSAGSFLGLECFQVPRRFVTAPHWLAPHGSAL